MGIIFAAKEIDCGASRFQCVNSSVCVHFHKVCDGAPNCPDKSDEIGCEDS